MRCFLSIFFRLHDPTQLNRQGPDIGDEYRSAIFYFTDEQMAAAEKATHVRQLKEAKQVVTQVVRAGIFYEAEPEHQKFTERTGIGMCHVPYAPISD